MMMCSRKYFETSVNPNSRRDYEVNYRHCTFSMHCWMYVGVFTMITRTTYKQKLFPKDMEFVIIKELPDYGQQYCIYVCSHWHSSHWLNMSQLPTLSHQKYSLKTGSNFVFHSLLHLWHICGIKTEGFPHLRTWNGKVVVVKSLKWRWEWLRNTCFVQHSKMVTRNGVDVLMGFTFLRARAWNTL